MREVTPQELREYNEQSWKETQKIFRKRLREIAAGGNSQAEYCEKGYCFGERIKPWLEGLGFVVKPDVRPFWWEITWPEEEDITEQLRRECMPILNSSLLDAARHAIDGLKVKGTDKLGTWAKDMERYDYVCSDCGKHAEYVSDYCPNCGKKMATLLDGNRY